MKHGMPWSSLPSPAIYPQGKVHVATIYINTLYNAAVRYHAAVNRHFVASGLIRKAATLQPGWKERMGENERWTNGTVSMTVLDSMAEHILDHDCLAATGANASETRSISELLEVRTRLHTELS